MELANNLDNNLLTSSNVTLEEQKGFLDSTLGKVINTGLDAGIRFLLPDLIEEQVIDVKDAIINNGFKAGVEEAISSAVDMGKSVIGIFTGKFENVTQAENAVKSGGIIDGISDALDYALNLCSKFGKIPNAICSVIKGGKDAILDTISNNIEEEFKNQVSSVEKINSYMQNWKNSYNNKDLDGMEKEYKKLEKELEKTLPLENTIKEARKIENIHILIKNKGDFNISNDELELAKKLII
mgnify:CR=1 FL=1